MGILDGTSLSVRDDASPDGIASVTSLNPANETANARLLNGAQANPDQAAKALHIGEDLGVDPRAVEQDFQHFDNVHRTGIAASIVGENPHLTGYVNSHPMAASVSKDDWLNLDDFTKTAQRITSTDFMTAGIKAFAKSLWEAPPVGSWMKPEEAMQYDRFGAWKMLGLPIEVPARLFSAGLQGLHAALSEMEKQYGLGAGFANTITGMAEYHLIAPHGAVHDVPAASKAVDQARGNISVRPTPEANRAIDPQQLDQARANIDEFRNTVGPYLEAGETPPVGLHPVTDALHAEQAKIDAENLKQALAAATKTDTRERSPELFADNLSKQVVGDQTVGINSQAIRELYGDKVPEPGDGILGWVPDLEAQLRNGGDVEVPVKDLLARIDPKVFNQISDFIRSRPDGMTLAEAKEGIEVYHGSAHEHEEFSDEYIGTGQGAASYGYGHYLAENKNVAQSYIPRDLRPYQVNGQEINADGLGSYSNAATPEAAAVFLIDRYQGNKQKALEDAKQHLSRATEDGETTPKFAREVIRLIQDDKVKPIKKGNLYRARILRQPEEFLDWDKTLAEQSPQVLEALGKLDLEAMAATDSALSGASFLDRMMRSYGGNDKTVSEVLNRHGIAGIKYLDQGSRNPTKEELQPQIDAIRKDIANANTPEGADILEAKTGLDVVKARSRMEDELADLLRQQETAPEKPTRNYVVFSDKDLLVTHRNDQPLKLVNDLRRAIAIRGAEEPKVRLEREGEPHERNEEETTHSFLVKDREDNDLASLILTEEEGGQRLYADDISAIEGGKAKSIEEAANSLGPGVMRDTLEQVVEQFPNAKELVGLRVSGARDKAAQGKGPESITKDMVRIDLTKIKPRRRAPKQLEFPEATRMEDRKPFAEPPIGFTKELYESYLKTIQKLQTEDAESIRKWAMEDARKAETKEWREARKEIKGDVEAGFINDPAFRFDELLRKGTVVNVKGLSEEVKAMIPEKNRTELRLRGTPIDLIAQMLDVTSGEALANHYAALAAERTASGLKPTAFREAKINAETDRRMQGEMGDLGKRIIDRAMDRLLSETQEELLHQETMRLAIQAGEQYEINPNKIKMKLRKEFDALPVKTINSKKYVNEAIRGARRAELASNKSDPVEAFREAQAREHAFLKARWAAEYEKAREQFDKRAKQFRDREVDSVPAEYTNAIHSILQKVELPVRRRPDDLQREMDAGGFTDLADWVSKKESEYSTEGIEFPVPDFLLDSRFKKELDDLSLNEFNGVKMAVDSLYHFGRDVQKIEIAGAKFDLEELVARMKEQLGQKFPILDAPFNRKAKDLRNLGKSALAATTGLETVFYRFDGRDPNGLFTKTFTYPGAEAANYKARLDREFGAKLKALGEIKDAEKLLTPPFADPSTGRPLQNFRRKNLLAIISNMGNESNWRMMTKGWKVEPMVLWDWVIENSTKEDFDRAHALSKIFSDAKDMSDVVYRNLYGVAPENIEVRPFRAHDKEYPGWYHPIIRDSERSNLSLLQTSDPLEKPTNYWPSTPNSYTKRRTGVIDVPDLTYDMVPVKLNQILHDVAMRAFVYNSAKLIRDKGFRRAVTDHYGREYVEEMDMWLQRAAGSASYNSEAMSRAARVSNMLRQNVVTTHIAFGLTTVEKHAATAAVMSAHELGPNTLVGALKLGKLTAEIGADYFYHAVTDLFGKDPYLGNTLAKFIHNTSEEIQRRERHYQDTVMDTHNVLEGKSNIRQMVAYYGAKAVAFSDKISAMPLWLGAYRKALDETGDHGMAVNQANFAVRRAHGSTAITSLPRIATGSGVLEPWMTTLYGFMGANMQRRLEIAHDISDTYNLGRSGEIKAAIKKVPKILDSFMANVVWVGLVEEAVSGQFTDDKRGLIEHALPFIFGTLAQTVIGARDLVWALTHGREPQVGLLSGFLQELGAVIRDMKKPHPLSKQNVGKFVEDAVAAIGDVTGMAPKPVGRALHYGIDVATGMQKPRTFGDVYRGIVSGRQTKRVEK